MKRILFSLAIFLGLSGVITAQVFTFECVGDYISGADCPECAGQTTARLFNGLRIKKSGTQFRNIDCPFIIKVQGNNLVFQEIINPNPETVTINLLSSGFSTITGFRDSTACMCARQDSSWIGGGVDTTHFVNASAATTHTLSLTPVPTGGSLQLAEGSGITLTTTGTALDGVVTIATTGAGANYQLWRDDGIDQTVRANANFLQSADINLILADDAGNTETEVSADILPNAVDYAEIQQVAASSLLGNPTGAPANVSEITLGTGLSFVGTVLTPADASATNEAWTIDADAGDTEVISNQTVLFDGAGINTTSYDAGTNTLTITGTEVDGSTTNEIETFVNTSDATSHTVTLAPGSTSVQLIEGANVTLTTGGSGSNGTVTIAAAAEVDGSITNEGILGVASGGANDALLTSNTSTANGVTVSGSTTAIVTESTSANGGTITIQADTSLIATVNDVNAARNRDDSTFARLPGELYHTKRITSNAYRYATTGFRTIDTTAVVNIHTPALKTAARITADTTANGTLFLSLKPPSFVNPLLANLQPFNFYGQRFEGVNSPFSTRPNYVWGLGWNLGTNGARLNTHEAAGGIHYETYFQTASLGGGGATGMTEFHLFTIDTTGTTNRFLSSAEPWDGRRWASILTLQTDKLNYSERNTSQVFSIDPQNNVFDFQDTMGLRFNEPRGFGLSVKNGANSAFLNIIDFTNTDTLQIARQNIPGVRFGAPPIFTHSKIYPDYLSTSLEIGSTVRKHNLIVNSPSTQALELRTGITAGVYGYNATPEAAIIANQGSIAQTNISSTGGLWLKKTGTGPTGWEQVLTSSFGSGVQHQVAFWNPTNTLTGTNNFTYTNTTPVLALAGIQAGQQDAVRITNTNAGANDQVMLRFWNDSGQTSSDGAVVGIASSGRSAPYASSFQVWNFENGPIVFGIVGSEKARFTTNGLIIGSTGNAANRLDVEGAAVIGATYSGTSAASTNGLLVEGNVGIGNTSAQRKLHVTGDVRFTDLVTDAPTGIVGADADGDLGLITLGSGFSITAGTLNFTGAGTNYQTLRWDGVAQTQRPVANFITSSDIDFTLADDAGNTETEINCDIKVAAVNYVEIQQVAASKLLGNPTGSPATVSEIGLGAGLAFSGTNLVLSGTVTAANNGLYISGGNTVRLGTNPLIEATTIDQDANQLNTKDGRLTVSRYDFSPYVAGNIFGALEVSGIGAVASSSVTPSEDYIMAVRGYNTGGAAYYSNTLFFGVNSTAADGVWMQARSESAYTTYYPLAVQPRGGQFSVGRINGLDAKATFSALALSGSTASGSVIHWENSEGNQKAAATFGVGTDVVDGEIAYFDATDIVRVTNRNTTTGTSSLRFAVGGETSDRVTIIASSTTPSARMGVGMTAPLSTLQSAGSLAASCITFTGALTLDERHYRVEYTGTTDITITLPTAANAANRMYVIHHRGTGGTITLSIAINKGNGATFSTLTAGQHVFIHSDGTAWNGIKLNSL